MSVTKHEIRQGAYYDSIVLMQLQKSLEKLPGVVEVGVMMATPANRDVFAATGFSLDGVDAKSDDLLIMVNADDEVLAGDALAQIDTLIKQRSAGGDRIAPEFRSRSLGAAAKNMPDAQWVLVSVPGRYAAGVAEEALDLGKHVFLFSDNVSLDDEVKLKQKARAKGLLVMGPDCGTAIIDGVGLGFANRVRSGNIGLVAASGTGLQAVTTHIHNLGGGISQAIGTGGRDLKQEVGGITALQSLDLLARDPETDVIVFISKPPAPNIATKLLNVAQSVASTTNKPIIINFIGYPPPAKNLGHVHFATSLDEAARLAASFSTEHKSSAEMTSTTQTQGYLRGLFSGGTLAYEMMLGLQTTLHPLYANVAIHPAQQLADVWQSQAHTIIDMGEDDFTQGRLHPMMDNDLRLRRLRSEAADPNVGMILLDVVLGEGAHPDPARELASVINEVMQAQPHLEIVCIVLGTDDDPQDISAQIAQLEQAGSTVFRTTSETLAYINQNFRATTSTDTTHPTLPIEHFDRNLQGGLNAINVGIETFYESLQRQGASITQVDWRPPAGGNEKLMAILAKMKKG
ncbi:MAG: acyl-CoA synthetase FdrA [Chloroflexota bacterium]